MPKNKKVPAPFRPIHTCAENKQKASLTESKPFGDKKKKTRHPQISGY